MDTKKEKQMHIMIMFFGALSVIMGIYNLINGGSINDQITSIFLGISLFGVGFMYYKKLSNNKTQ